MVKNLYSKIKYKNPNSHLKILDTERGFNLEGLYGASQGNSDTNFINIMHDPFYQGDSLVVNGMN